MDKVIVVDHLSCPSQLTNVSFSIQSGEMVAIVGPKKSGKLAILKILSGLLKPSSGFVSVLDHDPFLKNDDFLKQISFLFETGKKILTDLTPIEVLETTKEVYGLSNRDFAKNINDMARYITDPELLDALIYRPKIVFLNNQNIDLNQIYEYNIKNKAVVMIAEERLDNLLGLVRRIIIVNEGNLIFDGAIDEIIDKYAKEKLIKVRLSSDINIKDVEEIGVVKKYAYPHLQLLTPRSVANFTAAEILQKFPVTSLTIEELPIEDIINNMKS